MSCFYPNAVKYISPGEYQFLGSAKKFDDLSYNALQQIHFVPCGQCLGCRMDQSRQWAIRCMLEAKNYKYNYFVTLTFDDEHLEKCCTRENFIIDDETGCVNDIFYSKSINRSHVQKFMKDLREYYRIHFDHVGIRFFGCGEYGTQSGRPHYHLILFNCEIPDLEFYTERRGQTYYLSKIFRDIWKNGHVVIGECTFQSAAYVARYCTKKANSLEKSVYTENGLVPEFLCCSNRPGIGRSFYDENKHKMFYYDKVTLSDGNGKVLEVKPPRYYDKLYDIDEPEVHELIKNQRLKSYYNAQKQVKKCTSVKDYFEYLSIQENNTKGKIDKLKRNNI